MMRSPLGRSQEAMQEAMATEAGKPGPVRGRPRGPSYNLQFERQLTSAAMQYRGPRGVTVCV